MQRGGMRACGHGWIGLGRGCRGLRERETPLRSFSADEVCTLAAKPLEQQCNVANAVDDGAATAGDVPRSLGCQARGSSPTHQPTHFCRRPPLQLYELCLARTRYRYARVFELSDWLPTGPAKFSKVKARTFRALLLFTQTSRLSSAQHHFFLYTSVEAIFVALWALRATEGSKRTATLHTHTFYQVSGHMRTISLTHRGTEGTPVAQQSTAIFISGLFTPEGYTLVFSASCGNTAP